MDRLSPSHRSWNMGRIRGKDTKPELTIRSLLHRRGFRFRIHCKKLSGKPDIVLPKYRTAIFINGCFWHRHEGCSLAYMPKTRIEFWDKKFSATILRDSEAYRRLRAADWTVLVVWECEIRKNPAAVTDWLESQLRNYVGDADSGNACFSDKANVQ